MQPDTATAVPDADMMSMADEMAAWGEAVAALSAPAGIGDINSKAKGTGARLNAGKVPLELIPAGIIAGYEEWARRVKGRRAPDAPHWINALDELGRFQLRDGNAAEALYGAIYWSGADWRACARVFHFGKTKYAAWNWTKGMPWSVPLACAMRHVLFGPLAGEDLDADSGDTHAGHFMCNVVMLLFFLDAYPEGDDLYTPPTEQ